MEHTALADFAAIVFLLGAAIIAAIAPMVVIVLGVPVFGAHQLVVARRRGARPYRTHRSVL